MELWQYQGKPTAEEVLYRHQDRLRCGKDHLAIRHKCPVCSGRNTEWVRQEWSICYDCMMAFALENVLGHHNTKVYIQREELREELRKEVNMVTNWEPEQEETTPAMPLSYQVTAHIALEDSDRETWGMAKDTEGSFEWKSGNGVLVGKWSRSPSDGLIHVFLETPIMALVDKATQRFAEYAEMRREKAMISPRVGRVGKAAAKVPQLAPAPSEELTTISNLRKLLRK